MLRYNEEKVLEEIKNFDGEVTLFGGECTLYEDRFIKALETKNVRSVSTNMMDISGKRLELFRGKGLQHRGTRHDSHQNNIKYGCVILK